MIQIEETDVAWDLSGLFAGPDDPKIDAALQTAKERAEAFAAAYQGKINSPDLTAARCWRQSQNMKRSGRTQESRGHMPGCGSRRTQVTRHAGR